MQILHLRFRIPFGLYNNLRARGRNQDMNEENAESGRHMYYNLPVSADSN
jgi:hypothetical protein